MDEPNKNSISAAGLNIPRWLWTGVVIFAIWTVAGVMLSTPYILKELSWPDVIGRILEAWAWALMTPPLLWLDHVLTKKEVRLVSQTLIYAALSVPYSELHVYLTAILQYPIVEIYWSPFRAPENAVHYFSGGLLAYGVLIGVILAHKYYRRFVEERLELERTKKQFLEAHLNALRLQLEPHFLFNALNAISSEIGANPVSARTMIGDLAELLRHSLAFADEPEISLSQELTLLRSYVAIQHVRFGDRIRIHWEVEAEALDAVVPCMILQPLVENAIRHGLEPKMTGGTVRVSARKVENFLEIRVQDDGVGLPPNWRCESASGLGVRVTRERLSGLFEAPPDHLFSMNLRQSGGTEAKIIVPFRTHKARADAAYAA